MARELHCYEYVNRPFHDVRDALLNDAVGVFKRATQSATARAHTVVSGLKVRIAGLDVGKNVVIRVTRVDVRAEAPGHVSLLGSAADWLVGHRVAEASVHRFLEDVADRLGAELA
jgi:hypothetical protein